MRSKKGWMQRARAFVYLHWRIFTDLWGEDLHFLFISSSLAFISSLLLQFKRLCCIHGHKHWLKSPWNVRRNYVALHQWASAWQWYTFFPSVFRFVHVFFLSCATREIGVKWLVYFKGKGLGWRNTCFVALCDGILHEKWCKRKDVFTHLATQTTDD